MGDLIPTLDLKTVFGIAVALFASVNCIHIPIDIEFKDEIVDRHNKLRQQVSATYMNEVIWDEVLARKAHQWASRCKYQHPPEDSYPFNNNMYWMSGDILETDPDIVREFLNRALIHWEGTSQYYIYGPHCGRGCPYARMVDSDSERVGCAVQSCDNQYNTYVSSYPVAFTMIVCFYDPGKELRQSPPYQRGYPCSKCQGRSVCRNNLCVLSDRIPSYKTTRRPVPSREGLDYNERRLLLRAHNEMRRLEGLSDLQWDDTHLGRWVHYIIDCSVNYPGPRGTYSNFHRFQELEDITSVTNAWSREGDRTNIRFVHGCRTKNDAGVCNHYTNVIRPDINSIACATKSCGTRRHLVCLYDDMGERQYWRAYSERMRPRYRTTPGVRNTWRPRFNTPSPRPHHWYDHEHEFSRDSGQVLYDQQTVSRSPTPRRRPPPSINTKGSNPRSIITV